MSKSYHKLRTVLFLSAITGLNVPLYAQEAQEVNNPNLPIDANSDDVIIVDGFRASLQSARNIKRDNVGISEVIVAEDVAKFPDLNLAESLQRVPGITITRVRGEGNQISLRGLGPDFTRVQINGMEALANSERNRSFEFNVFASELFSRIDIDKTYRASLNAGGIGGTVNLRTAQPFDYADGQAVVSAQLGTNTNADELDYRVVGLVSARSDTVGALLSVAYSERTSQGLDVSTFRYRARNLGNADISALPTETQAQLRAAEIFIPRGNRLRISTEEQERLGATAALQWQPHDDILISLNGLYSNYTVDRDAQNIQTRGSNSFPNQNATTVAGVTTPPTVVRELRANAANELVFADFGRANIGTESTTNEIDVEFYQISLSGEFALTDRLSLTAMAGYAQTDNVAREDKFYAEQFGDVTLDFEGDRRLDPVITYGGGDLTDVSEWRAHEIDLRDSGRTSDFVNAQADAAYEFSDALTLRFGGIFQRFGNEGFVLTADNLLRSAWEAGTVDDDISALAFTVTGHPLGDWIGVDVDQAVAFYGLERDLDSAISEQFTLDEAVLAGYLQLDLDGDIGGVPVRANAGVRYVDLQRTTVGVLETPGGLVERRVETGRGDWLPALNVSAEILPDTLLRAAVSRNITRPPVNQLTPNASVRSQNFQDVVAGNPDLESFEADNFDLYVDHYFGSTGYVSAGFFYKDVRNFITRTSQTVPFGSLNLPLDLLQPDQDATTPFISTTFVNSQDADIKGLEVALQVDFDTLAAALSGFGIIANYTYADATLDFVNVGGTEVVTQSFPGLSEHSANGTLYYETDVWGVRGSVAYRSDFVTDVEVGLTDEDSRGTFGSTFVDASAFVNVTDRLRISLEALNITNVKERDYSDSSQRLTELRRSGSTFFAGLNFRY